MRVLDSNLWVMGTLDTNETAVELLEAIETGAITSVIDEYVLAEVLAAFDRVLDGRARDRVLTAFLTRLHSTFSAFDPTGHNLSALSIECVQ